MQIFLMFERLDQKLPAFNFRSKPKTLIPKSFLQFEPPRSLVLTPTPTPDLKKFALK